MQVSMWQLSGYIISVDDRALLGILSSKMIDFFYRSVSSSYRGGYLRFIYQYLAQIPIIQLNQQQRAILSNLVDQVIDYRNSLEGFATGDLESEIDRLVYELYGLTEEEIGMVVNEG